MNKFALTGIKNDKYRYEFTVKKNQAFVGSFIELLPELGFKNQEFYFLEYKKGQDSLIPIKINKLKEVCNNFKNKDYDIEIFYGNKRIILVIRTKKKDFLKKSSKWFKFKK